MGCSSRAALSEAHNFRNREGHFLLQLQLVHLHAECDCDETGLFVELQLRNRTAAASYGNEGFLVPIGRNEWLRESTQSIRNGPEHFKSEGVSFHIRVGRSSSYSKHYTSRRIRSTYPRTADSRDQAIQLCEQQRLGADVSGHIRCGGDIRRNTDAHRRLSARVRREFQFPVATASEN